MSVQTTDDTGAALLEDVRALGPAIRAAADEIERDRRLPPALVETLAERGLFKLSVPRAFGGGEADPATLVRVIEEVARADASTGWCLMIAIQSGTAAAYLPPEEAREIFGDPRAFVAGVVVPAGRAMAVDGGYRVTGHWRYASGCRHATWLTGAALVYDGDTPRQGAGGQPESRWLFFPAADCQIIDTWHVTGLRGTGSHDFAVEDLFVPHERTFPHRMGGSFGFEARDDHAGALYRFGIGLINVSSAAVSLGIARGALDAFAALVGGPGGAKAHLREDAPTQIKLGQAEAQLRAARAFLFEAMRQGWEQVLRAGDLPLEQGLQIRLATHHATSTAAQVVEALWYATGAMAIFESNPLERRFRDAHAAAQRVPPTIYGDAGRHWIGLAGGQPG